MSETFLSRWSRRKRANTSPRLRGEVDARSAAGEGTSTRGQAMESAPHPDPLPASGERETAPASRAGVREPESAEREAPAFDPATLPPIESIDAGTDVTAFLRPGVPAELTQAALRRAWSADPAIRDFVGLAENAWDFNAPGGVPGFEPLRAIDDVQHLAAQVFGALPAAASEGRAAEHGKDGDEIAEATPQQTPLPRAEAVTPVPPDDAAPQEEGGQDQRNRMTLRHGGALPE